MRAPSLLLLLAATGCMKPERDAEPPGAGSRLFQVVFAQVRAHAVDSLDDEQLYRLAAEGVVEELDDPYAVLSLPGENAAPPEDGTPPLGLFLDRRDRAVVVVSLVPGSPADSAGVRSGDRLVGVDTVAIDGSRLVLARRLLDGRPGTPVALRFRRASRPSLVITLKRTPPPRTGAVEALSLGGGVGQVRVRQFVPGIADTVREAIGALRRQGVRSLVLDLRGAVGGALAEGVAIADLFLGPGQILAVSRARSAAASRRFTDSSASPFDSLPLAVLVSFGTAGAGEVVAGALQDHDRAAVLGAVTFGRGVTQSTFALGGGASLRLTTALWMTPSGRQIQRPPQPAAGDSLPRPEVRSDGGRRLLGGGGIIPDRIVAETAGADLALAEARSLLIRAGSARKVLALVMEH